MLPLILNRPRNTRPHAAPAAALAFLAVLLFASAASAATYYVSTSGSDTNNGLSAGAPWRTIAKANATLVAGDVVRISPGTYPDVIQPTANGTSANRITYVGNLANPSSVSVSSIQTNGMDYISVKGVQATNDIGLNANSSGNSADRDSLVSCVGLAGLGIGGAWYCVVANCTIGTGDANDKMNIGVFPGDISTPNASITAWCTLQDNTFNFATAGGSNAMTYSHMRNNRFVRNRFILTVLPGVTDSHSNTYYRVKNNTFVDCSYTLRNLAAAFEPYVFNQRDSSAFNRWERDTFQVDPASVGPVKFEFTTSGAFPSSSKYNTWMNCFIKVDGTFGYQNAGRGDVLQGNVFATKNSFQPKGDSLTIRHNTIFNGTGTISWDCQQTDVTNSRVVSNLFYSTGATAGAHNYLPDVASVIADSNLVWATGNDATHAEYIRSSGGLSAVGSGTAWCTGYGKDCNSRWADPQFTSTSWSNLDLRPRSGSPAYLASWPDGYVGAFSSGSLVGDATPPSAVSNLAVGQIGGDNVSLSWTAPGDDGTSGTAAAYDIRWSTSPINASNFASATAFVTVPDPLGSGQTQTYVALGLQPTTAYWFALRTRDEMNNWSAISNVATATTTALDTTPPASITDLSATP
jgi:hypothetical protein